MKYFTKLIIEIFINFFNRNIHIQTNHREKVSAMTKFYRVKCERTTCGFNLLAYRLSNQIAA